MLSLLLQILSNFYYLALHVTGAGSFPAPLSSKRETELLEKSRAGNLDARNKLIEHNLRLVAHIVKKYYATGSNQDDLISIGTIGLIKAVSTFKSDKNIRLATYAARCIENEILMYMRASKKLQQEISLHECLGHDTDGNEITFIDILTAEDEDVSEKADLNMDTKKLYGHIKTALTDRERDIIMMRYGLLGKPITQHRIAKQLGISRSYVSRIEKKAVQKLTDAFNKQ